WCARASTAPRPSTAGRASPTRCSDRSPTSRRTSPWEHRAMADPTDPVFDLSERPVHLGLGATAVPQEPIDGMAWYERYGERTEADGAEGRLVSMYTFTESRDAWELHPDGDE